MKERAASTENMLNSEFRKLEESVDKALSLNRQKIRDAISEHTTSVKKQLDTLSGTVAKLAMRQPFVLFKGLTFQKLCL
ncbi:MbeB family mobilization protein, partial [Escherichia coli]|uniref:MbeB family mobilization protein n=1 Tax=Escherichia coli TaxID=562 RepID=UPI003F1F78FC